MAQFTFVELHFEEGAIPIPEILRTDETDESESTAHSRGYGLGAVLLAILGLAIGIALARKLLGEDEDLLDEN